MTLTIRYRLFFLLLLCWPFFNRAEAFNGLLPINSLQLAPQLVLKDTEGREHRLAEARGKVVLVNFWATWCPPCRKEMPSMERLWKRLGDKNFIIYAVNVGESAEDVGIFAFEHELSFPVLLDLDADTVRQWRVRGLPTSFLLDTQGRLAYQAIGERDWDDPAIVKTVQDLMESQP